MQIMAAQFAGSLVVALLMGSVLLYLRSRDHAPYMDCWARSFFADGLRQAAALTMIVIGPSKFLEVVMYLAVLLAGLFLLRGTYLFLGRDAPKAWLGVGALVAAWTSYAVLTDVDFLLATAPLFVFRGTTDIIGGVSILRRRVEGAGSLVAGIALVLWGIHRMDYPLLRPIEWFAPWGFGLAAALGSVVGVGMMMMHYEKARRDVERREAEFRTMFDNALDGYFRVDQDGTILLANPAFSQMLGLTQERLLGRRLTEFMTTETSSDALAGLVDAETEQIWRREDERRIYVLLRVQSVERHGKQFYEGSVRDVSETRLMQEQLDLARRMDALGRLAGGIAHDFNNILTAIMGGVDLAEMELADGVSPASNLAIIRLSASKAADLASHLLAFTRQRQGEAVPTRLDGAIDNIERMLQRLLPDNITLVVRRDADNLCVSAEPGQLERVILNLAVNAQDAMATGGTLTIQSSVAGNRVKLVVTDTGHGMDQELVQKIFEPYFSTKLDKGTGLGLANVQRIVEAMGGDIDVRSAIGEGSEFTVHFPVVNGRAQEMDTTTSLEPLPKVSGHPTVLLVEDRDFVRRSTHRLLERAGYRVLVAKDAEEAMRTAEAELHTIDVVLSDILLPRMSGRKLVATLLGWRPDLPYLLMSAHSEESLTDEEAAHFIAKPFSGSELVRRLELVRTRTTPPSVLPDDSVPTPIRPHP